MKIKMNAGDLDRGIRVVVGFALIALAVIDVFAPWGYIGVVPVLTGLFGFCPAYTLLGMNTCPMDKKSE